MSVEEYRKRFNVSTVAELEQLLQARGYMMRVAFANGQWTAELHGVQRPTCIGFDESMECAILKALAALR